MTTLDITQPIVFGVGEPPRVPDADSPDGVRAGIAVLPRLQDRVLALINGTEDTAQVMAWAAAGHRIADAWSRWAPDGVQRPAERMGPLADHLDYLEGFLLGKAPDRIPLAGRASRYRPQPLQLEPDPHRHRDFAAEHRPPPDPPDIVVDLAKGPVTGWGGSGDPVQALLRADRAHTQAKQHKGTHRGKASLKAWARYRDAVAPIAIGYWREWAEVANNDLQRAWDTPPLPAQQPATRTTGWWSRPAGQRPQPTAPPNRRGNSWH